jgi:CDP-2,3-bis-(O-geranylgeranyl)-sn-glycerol synthase
MTLEHAFYALLFFLPAGISNMTPVLASRLPGLRAWRTPIDLGRTFRGKRLLGPNKTWRGLVCGTIAGTLTGILIYGSLFTDENKLTLICVWAAMSFGALVGDAVESFFKRQRGIVSGQAWFPFDQTDYIIGGLLFILPFGILPLWLVVWIFVIYFGLHLVSSYVGYLLGLKDQPI